MSVPQTLKAWLQASRLPSQSYIALPLLLGQILAYALTGAWSWPLFFLVQTFGVFDQLYIVYANDYADRETDQDNQTATIFSGGSRVLVDGSISPRALKRAALLMAFFAMATTFAMGLFFQRPAAIPLGAFGLLLLWAYSYPPFRLSYRGGGEFLQMLGVGAVLPLLAFYAQTGSLTAFPWPLLLTLLPFSLATAISTALPDLPSDRRADKKTIPVTLGLLPSHLLIFLLYALGFLAFHLSRSYHFFFLQDPRAPLFADILLYLSLGALILLLPLLRRSTPGSPFIVVFVFNSILVNLSWTASLIVALLLP